MNFLDDIIALIHRRAQQYLQQWPKKVPPQRDDVVRRKHNSVTANAAAAPVVGSEAEMSSHPAEELVKQWERSESLSLRL